MSGNTIRESKRLTNWFCFFFRFEEEEEDREASLVVVMADDIFAFRGERNARERVSAPFCADLVPNVVTTSGE